jgi:hypothetical protein
MTHPSPNVERKRSGLQRIYEDLRAGRTSKHAALREISLLKRGQSRDAAELLLSVPVWQSADASAGAEVRYAERHVALCGLAKVSAQELNRLIPGSRCTQWQSLNAEDLANNYHQTAAACFQKVQDILRSHPQGKVLLQIVVAEDGESELLAGLSGFLKTATLENPQFLGQIILTEPQIVATDLAVQLQKDAALPRHQVVKHSGGTRRILQWKTARASGESPAVAFKDRGVYLITGGLGAVGRLLAREILDRVGQARVIVTGRGALTPE